MVEKSTQVVAGPTKALQEASTSTRVIAVAGGVAALALSYYLIWFLASLGLGLAVVGLVGAGLFAGVKYLQVFGQKLENKILQARKAEARKNPIEQRQNEFRRRSAQIEATRKALGQIKGQIEGMVDMISDQRKTDPGYDFTKQERSVEKMQSFYTQRVNKLVRAQKALEDFEKLIERNIFEWNFAQQGRVALENMNASDQESILQEMLSDEAGRAIQAEFNAVCADLDSEVLDLNSTTKLSFDGGMYLDMSAIKIPEMSTTSRK